MEILRLFFIFLIAYSIVIQSSRDLRFSLETTNFQFHMRSMSFWVIFSGTKRDDGKYDVWSQKQKFLLLNNLKAFSTFFFETQQHHHRTSHSNELFRSDVREVYTDTL